jgi:hypothetical protein
MSFASRERDQLLTLSHLDCLATGLEMSPVHVGLMLEGLFVEDSDKIDPGCSHDARYAMQQSNVVVAENSQYRSWRSQTFGYASSLSYKRLLQSGE